MTSAERRACRLAAAGLSVVGLSVVVACSRPSSTEQSPPPRPQPQAPAPAPPTPTPAPVEIPKAMLPVDRGALLAAVAEAADAYATGKTSPASVAELAGRRFEVVLPFGCHGSPPETAALRYAWDGEARKVKLTVTPQTWTKVPWVRELVASEDDAEAIEGFWLSRPWIRSADCAAQPAVSGAPASAETVGLAQVFEKGGSRLLRRNGRPYEVTRKLDADQAPPMEGYRLAVSGRIADTGETPPIRCRSDGPDQRPTCLVRVELDRVELRSGTGEEIAAWAN
jgi:hypothetical protein